MAENLYFIVNYAHYVILLGKHLIKRKVWPYQCSTVCTVRRIMHVGEIALTVYLSNKNCNCCIIGNLYDSSGSNCSIAFYSEDGGNMLLHNSTCQDGELNSH
jgi:hypothetical protein